MYGIFIVERPFEDQIKNVVTLPVIQARQENQIHADVTTNTVIALITLSHEKYIRHGFIVSANDNYVTS